VDVTGPTLEVSRKDGGHARASRRSRVSPDIWQDTLNLLCDSDYSVRADYTEALVFYLSNEIPKRGDMADSDGVKRTRRLAEGPLQQAMNMAPLLHGGDFGTKFLNAVHAYLYILSTTSSLGLTSSSSTSPSQSMVDDSGVNVIPSTPTELDSERRDSFTLSQPTGRRSFSVPQGPRLRKVSMVQRLLEGTVSGVSASTAACLADYAHVLHILTSIHEQLPVRGLLTGIPMLLALDAATKPQDTDDLHMLYRINVIKEVIARVWLVVGKVWKSSDIVDIVQKVCQLLEYKNLLLNEI
jgi:protein EFR3